MKKLLMVAVIGLASCAGGRGALDSPGCKIPTMCQMFVGPHLANHAKPIKDNWDDFFGSDLEQILPNKFAATTLSIKFDGLGCLYPEGSKEIHQIENEFEDTALDTRIFHKESFYHLYEHPKFISSPAVKRFREEVGFESSMPRLMPDNPDEAQKQQAIKAMGGLRYFKFADEWNRKFLPSKIDQINAAAGSSKIKRIIFFIHGYNVPYSLAQIQGNELSKTLNESGLNTDEVLFVRVLWPSGFRKRDDFSDNTCNYDNFENAKTAVAFTYYSNRTFMAAIYLRQIIRGIDRKDIDVDIITHSHGSSLASALLVNATSRMQSGVLSNFIAMRMLCEPLPDRNIDVFMNAPSIPGVNTFTDLASGSPQSKYRFHVGFAPHDKVLLKRKLPVLTSLKFSAIISATTLGCDFKGEIGKTKEIFRERGHGDNFKATKISDELQHDFFCALQQQGMKDALQDFFK